MSESSQPFNLNDLTRSLRLVAQRANDPRVAAEYLAAADQLDNAIRLTDERGDRALRNTLQTALGMAELGLSDHLRGVADDVRALAGEIKSNTAIVNEVHQRLAESQAEQREGVAAVIALRSDFLAFGERISGRLATHDETLAEHARRLAEHDTARDESIAERKELRASVNSLTNEFHVFRDEIRELIAQAMPREHIERYLTFLDDLLRERGADHAERE